MAEPLVPLRSLIRLEHVGGATKVVELVGFATYGPRRATIYWPSAGHYEIDLNEGRIVGLPASLTAAWRVPEDVLEQLREAEQNARPGRGRKRGAS